MKDQGFTPERRTRARARHAARVLPQLPARLSASAATAASATEAAATTAAAGACRHGLRLVDGEVAPAEVVVVQLFDRALRFLVGGHLDEAEAPGASRRHVAHDLHAFDGAASREELFEILLARGVRKVTHVKFSTHR